MSRQVESDIETRVKRFTITFVKYIRRSRSGVIIELKETALQITLCGR
jgi:hypothetical protein